MVRPAAVPPSIETLLSGAEGAALVQDFGRLRTRDALRLACEALRRGELRDDGALVADARRRLGTRRAGPRPVINATGVLLHTNLGRAPLAEAAKDAVLAAAGYGTLEYDLASGERGKRGAHVRELLLAVFAPGRAGMDAMAVTNNAAAILLALDTLANGRPVAVSRGELVAIGGDFRVPSILARSGATLLEVGTTNKTTLADYQEALEAGAGLLLKVHPSNYRIVGFTESVELPELAALAASRGVPLVYDAGAAAPWEEPLGDAADLVCFSGDKTLGGPQAGILLGRREPIARCARNPLARALRPDKLALAALAATLELVALGRQREIPYLRMKTAPLDELEARAAALAERVGAAGLLAEVVPSSATAGGGAGDGHELPSWAVRVLSPAHGANELAEALRLGDPPVIARIARDAVLLDLRTIDPGDDVVVARAIAATVPAP